MAAQRSATARHHWSHICRNLRHSAPLSPSPRCDMAEGRCSRSTPNVQPHLAVRCLLPANPPPWQCFSPRPPVFRSAFAPYTIVPPSGGTQPLPPNPNPLLPNQAPPELVAESPLDPVGTTPHPHHHIISHLPRPQCTSLLHYFPGSLPLIFPGILALFLSQGPSAPSPATQQPAAATQQPAAAPSEQPHVFILVTSRTSPHLM
jgi:hypothetical protein